MLLVRAEAFQLSLKRHQMSHSLNSLKRLGFRDSLKGGYIGDCIGDY